MCAFLSCYDSNMLPGLFQLFVCDYSDHKLSISFNLLQMRGSHVIPKADFNCKCSVGLTCYWFQRGFV